MKVLNTVAILEMIQREGLSNFMRKGMEYLKEDFRRWEDFGKVERVGSYFKEGVIELMPVWDGEYYAYKYVNGHAGNHRFGKQTVIALGQLSEVETGYPILLTDMTVLTAIRTACVSGIATSLLGREDIRGLSFIGTGSQSEFQGVAHLLVCGGCEVMRYYDSSEGKMGKFERNMKEYLWREGLEGVELMGCKGVQECIEGSDCITTGTAGVFKQEEVLKDEWVELGMHINGIGGDARGKTELDKRILKRSKIVVEFFDQTRNEGEIQQLEDGEWEGREYYELHEVVKGKEVREREEDITLFDSVGFAMEDFSILRLVKDLDEGYGLGRDIGLFPGEVESGDLFSLLREKEG